MSYRQVCCCNTKTWTISIGILGLLVSARLLFWCFSFATHISTMTEENFKVEWGEFTDNANVTQLDADGAWTFFNSVLYLPLLMAIIGLAMNLILVLGCYLENPSVLLGWIVYGFNHIFIVFLFFAVASTKLELFLGLKTFTFGAVVGYGILHVFFIWVVHVHKRELDISPAKLARKEEIVQLVL